MTTPTSPPSGSSNIYNSASAPAHFSTSMSMVSPSNVHTSRSVLSDAGGDPISSTLPQPSHLLPLVPSASVVPPPMPKGPKPKAKKKYDTLPRPSTTSTNAASTTTSTSTASSSSTTSASHSPVKGPLRASASSASSASQTPPSPSSLPLSYGMSHSHLPLLRERLENYMLYETKSKYYLIGSPSSNSYYKILKIDRLLDRALFTPGMNGVSEDGNEYSYRELQELLHMIHQGNMHTGGMKQVLPVCYGIFGFIRFVTGYYMIIVTQRRLVGKIGAHLIHEVSETTMIPVTHPSASPLGPVLSTKESMMKAIGMGGKEKEEKDKKSGSKVNLSSSPQQQQPHHPDLPSSLASKIRANETRYRNIFSGLDLNKNFYYCTTGYDLTRTLQENMLEAGRRSGESGEEGGDGSNTTASTPSSSTTTSSSSTTSSATPTPPQPPKSRCLWNNYLLNRFYRAMYETTQEYADAEAVRQAAQQQTETNDDGSATDSHTPPPDSDDLDSPYSDIDAPHIWSPCSPTSHTNPASKWCLLLTHGFFLQKHLSILNNILDLTLIARRSRFYAGTRYLKRGLNNQGQVANDVETEQILSMRTSNTRGDHLEGSYTSYVQLRGSIPLYWSQESNAIVAQPAIVMNKHNPVHVETRTHFEDVWKRYGSPLLVLNLVKQNEKLSKKRESIIGDALGESIEFINSMIPQHEKQHSIDYLAWDFKRVRQSKTHSVVNELGVISQWALRRTGIFHSRPNPLAFPQTPEMTWKIKPDRESIRKCVHGDGSNGAAIQPSSSTQSSFTSEYRSRYRYLLASHIQSLLNNPSTNITTGTSSSSSQQQQQIVALKEWWKEQMTPKIVPRPLSSPSYPLLPHPHHHLGFLQRGVLRTNCIDSLDRTNVGQFCIGKCALSYQLYALGLIDTEQLVSGDGISSGSSSSSSNPTQTPDSNAPSTSNASSELVNILLDMYESHGDELSQQYGGSAMHRTIKSDRSKDGKNTLTLSQKKTMSTQSSEVLVSIRRHIQNSFQDTGKQDAINLFLGYFVVPEPEMSLAGSGGSGANSHQSGHASTSSGIKSFFSSHLSSSAHQSHGFHPATTSSSSSSSSSSHHTSNISSPRAGTDARAPPMTPMTTANGISSTDPLLTTTAAELSAEGQMTPSSMSGGGEKSRSSSVTELASPALPRKFTFILPHNMQSSSGHNSHGNGNSHPHHSHHHHHLLMPHIWDLSSDYYLHNPKHLSLIQFTPSTLSPTASFLQTDQQQSPPAVLELGHKLYLGDAWFRRPIQEFERGLKGYIPNWLMSWPEPEKEEVKGKNGKKEMKMITSGAVMEKEEKSIEGSEKKDEKISSPEGVSSDDTSKPSSSSSLSPSIATSTPPTNELLLTTLPPRRHQSHYYTNLHHGTTLICFDEILPMEQYKVLVVSTAIGGGTGTNVTAANGGQSTPNSTKHSSSSSMSASAYSLIPRFLWRRNKAEDEDVEEEGTLDEDSSGGLDHSHGHGHGGHHTRSNTLFSSNFTMIPSSPLPTHATGSNSPVSTSGGGNSANSNNSLPSAWLEDEQTVDMMLEESGLMDGDLANRKQMDGNSQAGGGAASSSSGAQNQTPTKQQQQQQHSSHMRGLSILPSHFAHPSQSPAQAQTNAQHLSPPMHAHSIHHQAHQQHTPSHAPHPIGVNVVAQPSSSSPQQQHQPQTGAPSRKNTLVTNTSPMQHPLMPDTSANAGSMMIPMSAAGASTSASSHRHSIFSSTSSSTLPPTTPASISSIMTASTTTSSMITITPEIVIPDIYTEYLKLGHCIPYDPPTKEEMSEKEKKRRQVYEYVSSMKVEKNLIIQPIGVGMSVSVPTMTSAANAPVASPPPPPAKKMMPLYAAPPPPVSSSTAVPSTPVAVLPSSVTSNYIAPPAVPSSLSHSSHGFSSLLDAGNTFVSQQDVAHALHVGNAPSSIETFLEYEQARAQHEKLMLEKQTMNGSVSSASSSSAFHQSSNVYGSHTNLLLLASPKPPTLPQKLHAAGTNSSMMLSSGSTTSLINLAASSSSASSSVQNQNYPLTAAPSPLFFLSPSASPTSSVSASSAVSPSHSNQSATAESLIFSHAPPTSSISLRNQKRAEFYSSYLKRGEYDAEYMQLMYDSRKSVEMMKPIVVEVEAVGMEAEEEGIYAQYINTEVLGVC